MCVCVSFYSYISQTCCIEASRHNPLLMTENLCRQIIYSEVKLVLIQNGSSLNCLRLLCHSFKYANKPVTTTERAASWINDPKSRFQYIRIQYKNLKGYIYTKVHHMKGVVQQPPVVFQTLLLRVTKYVLIPAALLSTNICTVHHFNTKKLIDFFGGINI